jgi:pSer/pThr/pTyr-binding forkhead associated (FHA) protein
LQIFCYNVFYSKLNEEREYSAMNRILILVVIVIYFTSVNSAQSLNTLVQSVSTEERSDFFSLDVYFSIVDQQGNLIDDADIDQVEIQVNGLPIPPQRQVSSQATIPYYVLILADISGSMTESYRQLVEMASEIENSAPEQGQFSLMSFADRIYASSDFGSMSNVVEQLNTLRPINNSGTCFFNAVAEGVNYIKSYGQAGRLALVILSDGLDRMPNSNNPCSSITVDEIINEAKDIVPIYSIGIRGNEGLNTGDLSRLASETSGIYLDSNSQNIGGSLNEVMDVLSRQWHVQFQLYPQAQSYQATVTPIFNTGAIGQPVQINFTSTRAYAVPFQLCNTNQGLSYDIANDLLSYNLCSQGTERVQTLTYNVIDNSTNLALFNSPRSINISQEFLYLVPSELNLQIGGSYTLELQGTDTNGSPLFTEPLRVEFAYLGNQEEEEQVFLGVSGLVINQESKIVTVEVTIESGMNRITELQLRPVADDGVISNSITIEPQANVVNFELMLDDLKPDSSYTLQISPYDSEGLIREGQIEHNLDTPPLPVQELRIESSRQEGTDTDQVYVMELVLLGVNLNETAKLEYKVLNQNNQTVADGDFQNFPSTLEIPISKLSSGNYIIQLDVKNSSNQPVVATQVEVGLIINFSPGYQILNIMRSPIFLFLLLVIIGGLGYVVYELYFKKAKVKDYTPPRHPTEKIDTDDATIIRRPTITNDDSFRARQSKNVLAQLVIMKSESYPEGKIFEIYGDPKKSKVYRIGRGREPEREKCDLEFDDKDSMVSREHIRIEWVPEKRYFILYNLSRYGFSVNSHKLNAIEEHREIFPDQNSVIQIPNSKGVALRLIPKVNSKT